MNRWRTYLILQDTVRPEQSVRRFIRISSVTKNCAVTLKPRHCEGAQATAAIQRLSL